MVQSIIDAGGGFVGLDDRDDPATTLSIVRPIWDRVFGIWVHEPGNADIDTVVRKARQRVVDAGLEARPVILVIATNAVLAADYNPNNAADWIAPEAYEPTTTDDWASAQGRMSRLIQRRASGAFTRLQISQPWATGVWTLAARMPEAVMALK